MQPPNLLTVLALLFEHHLRSVKGENDMHGQLVWVFAQQIG
jgi:hypothetical protein